MRVAIVRQQEDRARVNVEQLLGVSSNAVHHCLDVKGRRHVATDLGQRRALSGAPSDLVKQIGILQRHAHHTGQRFEQADIAVRERVLMLVAGHADQPVDLVGPRERDPYARLFIGGGSRQPLRPQLAGRLDEVLVDHEGLAGRGNVGEESADRHRCELQTLALVVEVLELDEPGSRIQDADVEVGGVEDLADLVADGVVDALHVPLGGQRGLDAVHDRELGRPLLALGEESLGLGELSGVLQRDAQRAGQRLQKSHVGRTERVLALVAGEVQEPAHFAAPHERHPHAGFLARRRTGHSRRAELQRFGVEVLSDDQGLPGLEDVGEDANDRDRVDGDPLAAVVQVLELDELGVGIEDPNR